MVTVVNRPGVLVVDAQRLFGEAVASALRQVGFTDVRRAESHGALLEHALVDEGGRLPVAVVSLHLHARDETLACIETLADHNIHVLALVTGHDRLAMARCLEAGASGIFSADQPLDNLVSLIDDAARGVTTLEPERRTELLKALREERSLNAELRWLFSTLTESEAAVLADLMDGRSADEVAARRDVAVSTVRSQIKSVLLKLGVNSQLAAVALARRAGWSTAISA